MSNQYNEDSIQKLSPLEFTRLRPDTYCGSTEDSTQLVVELITNCKDEFLIGNCSEVFVTIDEKQNIVTVRDEGQGIIPNLKKDDKTILEMVYGDLNTSGKYDKSDDAVYKESTGAFGIGASLSNYLAHWLTATTKRDGQFETVYFIEGVFSKRESGKCSKEEHGVEVSFQPSEEFFKNAAPSIPKLKKMMFEDSCVCPGLKYHFNGQEFYHPEGLSALIKSDNNITSLFAEITEYPTSFLSIISFESIIYSSLIAVTINRVQRIKRNTLRIELIQSIRIILTLYWLHCLIRSAKYTEDNPVFIESLNDVASFILKIKLDHKLSKSTTVPSLTNSFMSSSERLQYTMIGSDTEVKPYSKGDSSIRLK